MERSDLPRADPRQKAQRNGNKRLIEKQACISCDGKRIEISLAIAPKFKDSSALIEITEACRKIDGVRLRCSPLNLQSRAPSYLNPTRIEE
jgi:hypothetical protein